MTTATRSDGRGTAVVGGGRLRVVVAAHYGMCFGVRDALAATRELASGKPVTVLGDLVHNPVVLRDLEARGVRRAELEAAPDEVAGDVVITAHGASDRERERWAGSGRGVTDTTCPLVRRAHTALARLVAAGYAPVVIGRAGHVEVRGLAGDFPGCAVVLSEAEVAALPWRERVGVVAQTTQPVARVRALVARIRERMDGAEVKFIDTVCQPTKDRQVALEALCRECEVVVVVGGHHSNNTSQLAETARRLGVCAYHVAGPEEVEAGWFDGVGVVGVTAGTSTLDETVEAVRSRIEAIGAVR